MANKEEVLRGLAKEWGILPIQENELTSMDISETIKELGLQMSRTVIQARLKALAGEGLLTSRQIAGERGGNLLAYSPIDGKTWEDVLQYIKKK